MNSSISASEGGLGTDRWRGLLVCYALTTFGIAALLALLLLALDPYDTGRFAVFGEHGVPRFGQRLTTASLARQPLFDTAIIGNSTIQLIDPARLGMLSQRRVVSLAIPGTGPHEQLAVAAWFVDHHPAEKLRGLVIGLDAWCGANALEPVNAFPFWLYSPSILDYATGMMRLKSIDAAFRKVALLTGHAEPARPDGFSDYEIGRSWDAASVSARLAQELPALRNPPIGDGRADIASARRLKQFLVRLPAHLPLVLVLPPRFENGGAADETCEAAFAALAHDRERTRLVDFRQRTDLTGRVENFWDVAHYRASVARIMEVEIAAMLQEAE
jgi:hypothetical protein